MGTSCMVGEKVVACEAKVVGAGTWVAASSLEQQSEDGRAAERCRAHMSAWWERKVRLVKPW